MKRYAMILAAVLITPIVAWAGPQDRPEQGEAESLRAYLNRVAPLEEEAQKQEAADDTTKAAANNITGAVIEKQAVNPAGTAAASGFADRVNGTLQNFLPFFQGSIDAIDTSEDGRTVTLRLNPVRGRTFGELGFTTSLAEPEPSEALLKLLPDDSRPGQREVIQKSLDDFTDLTYAAAYNYVRKLEPEHLTDATPRRWFFGRNPRLYEELFASFAGQVLEVQADASDEVIASLSERFDEGVDIEGLDRKVLETTLGAQGYRQLVDAKLAERSSLLSLLPKVRQRAELFGKLAANQPQATLSLVYHERDPLVGRNETSADLSIEMPSVPNINELLRSWRRAGRNWQRALDDLQAREGEINAGTKWSFVASYKEADPYKVSYQPTTDGATPVTLELPRSHELSIKFQYSRNATWQERTVDGEEAYPALHISGEIIDVSDDSDRQDRRVITATYDIPMGRRGFSVPLSIIYANRPEFLNDPDHQLSAHFGLNLNAFFRNLRN